MKTLLSSFFLLFFAHAITNAQTASTKGTDVKNVKIKTNFETQLAYNDTDFDKTTFQYMTGSDKVPGYEIKICKFSDSSTRPLPLKTFSNGKSAPILQVYVSTKIKYIGGILENEKGVKTTITNITLVESGNTLLFTVTGKDFSMSFTLENGCMLKEDEATTVFNTDKVGIWKINKKK